MNPVVLAAHAECAIHAETGLAARGEKLQRSGSVLVLVDITQSAVGAATDHRLMLVVVDAQAVAEEQVRVRDHRDHRQGSQGFADQVSARGNRTMGPPILEDSGADDGVRGQGERLGVSL